MTKKMEEVTELKVVRPKRIKLSKKEVVKRMQAFPEREGEFIASIRKGKN